MRDFEKQRKAQDQFDQLVYDLRQSGIPFSQIRLRDDVKKIRDAIYGGWWGEISHASVSSAFSREAQKRGVEHDFTCKVCHKAKATAINILLEAGLSEFEIASAFGISKMNVRHSSKFREPKPLAFDEFADQLKEPLFSVRTNNCLESINIELDPERVAKLGKSYLMSIPNFGKKCLSEVEEWVSANGYTLAD